MTYEEIKKANEAIRFTDVKGKDYAEVNQRIKAFRMVYPDGFILTEMTYNENGMCVFRAQVGFYTDENEPITLATGTAYEKEGSTYINKTSYIENCETSAVGRALGIAGFGIDTSVASAEEVQNAIANQEREAAPPTKIICEDCGCEFQECVDQNGKKWLPIELKQLSISKSADGKCYCPNCLKKHMKTSRKTAPATTPTEE